MTKLIKGRDLLEEAAFEFLTTKFSNVCYEPNGASSFPDFCVNQKLLYEVTRLEKTVTQNGGDIHHSRAYIPLVRSVERTIETFSGQVSGGRHVFINLDVCFPCDTSTLRNSFRKFLLRASERPEEFRGKEHHLSDGIFASVQIGSKADCPKINLGWISPTNLTGWVVPDVVDQAIDALERKGEKLLSYRGTFEEAWLVVGGGAALGFRLEDTKFLQAHINSDFGWTGIVIINPQNPGRTIEVRFDR
jgi:hypothetical protein